MNRFVALAGGAMLAILALGFGQKASAQLTARDIGETSTDPAHQAQIRQRLYQAFNLWFTRAMSAREQGDCVTFETYRRGLRIYSEEDIRHEAGSARGWGTPHYVPRTFLPPKQRRELLNRKAELYLLLRDLDCPPRTAAQRQAEQAVRTARQIAEQTRTAASQSAPVPLPAAAAAPGAPATSSTGLFGTGSQVQWGPVRDAVYVGTQPARAPGGTADSQLHTQRGWVFDALGAAAVGGSAFYSRAHQDVTRLAQVVGGQRVPILTVNNPDGIGGGGQISVSTPWWVTRGPGADTTRPATLPWRARLTYGFSQWEGTASGNTGVLPVQTINSINGSADIFCFGQATFMNHVFRVTRHIAEFGAERTSGGFFNRLPAAGWVIQEGYGVQLVYHEITDVYTANFPAVGLVSTHDARTEAWGGGPFINLRATSPALVAGPGEFRIFVAGQIGANLLAESSEITLRANGAGVNAFQHVSSSATRLAPHGLFETGVNIRSGRMEFRVGGFFGFNSTLNWLTPGGGAPASTERTYETNAGVMAAFTISDPLDLERRYFGIPR
jgi:hypothetical protein